MDPLLFLERLTELYPDREVFVAGGPVRDWLLGRPVLDVDLVLDREAIAAARRMAELSSGSFVMLDEDFNVARVAVGGYSFDFSQYRGQSGSITEDLSLRDFTINAMAVPVEAVLDEITLDGRGLMVRPDGLHGLLIDPFKGEHDLASRTVRAVSKANLQSDPLRNLRAFRFAAVLGFRIEPVTLEWIAALSQSIGICSPERINGELDKIMASSRAGATLKTMHECGLLAAVIPETRSMDGVEQPGFHHLDVLGHLIEAVACMDELTSDPGLKFSTPGPIREWLDENRQRISWLKWAAFMHDFGKPAQKAVREDGRVTFYEHDKVGAQMAREVGLRLRWPKAQQKFVARMIRLHMRPFHLLNDLRRSGPSKRAMRRLIEGTGPDYPALFMLAMADSMAGCGPMKPAGLDDELSLLFERVHSFYIKSLKPVEDSPPLLRGGDVMKALGTGPGPVVGRALRAVKEAQVEGRISTRQEALELVKTLFERQVSP